jgi:hypothetical protein
MTQELKLSELNRPGFRGGFSCWASLRLALGLNVDGPAAAFLQAKRLLRKDELAIMLHGGQRQVRCQETSHEQGAPPPSVTGT